MTPFPPLWTVSAHRSRHSLRERCEGFRFLASGSAFTSDWRCHTSLQLDEQLRREQLERKRNPPIEIFVPRIRHLCVASLRKKSLQDTHDVTRPPPSRFQGPHTAYSGHSAWGPPSSLSKSQARMASQTSKCVTRATAHSLHFCKSSSSKSSTPLVDRRAGKTG